MRRSVIVVIFSFLIGLTSCEKEKHELPGKIPGMGTAGGELAIDQDFKMPEGVVIIGDITGLSPEMTGYTRRGSGEAVRLQMTITNTTQKDTIIYFPKGLLLKSDRPDLYQNGMLLQATWVDVAANSEMKVFLDSYCINLGIPGPDENATYTIPGTTGSELMKELLETVSWSMINYEMVHNSQIYSCPLTYGEITDRLQNIVHNVTTRGIDVTAEDKEFIVGIPELPEEYRPLTETN